MSINLLFKDYAKENLQQIPHPTQNKSFIFNNLNELIDLLFRFLDYEIDEPTLMRVKNNFEINFLKIEEFTVKELPNAIEGLATNFEPFLKKIAYIKYFNTLYWNGNNIYEGINKSTLGDLISGELPLKKGIPIETIREKYPEQLITKSGTSGAILDFVRSELRNAVHYAKNYNRVQLVQYSNTVLGAYLLAIYDNKNFLQKRFFPEFKYLETIVSNKDYIKLNNNYINLIGQEELLIIDNIAIEVLDGDKLIANLNSDLLEDDVRPEGEVIQKEISRVDSVLNIAKDVSKFIVVGQPGPGKSTTLQKILYDNALGILNGDKNCKLPILINASSYSPSKSLKNLLSYKIDFIDLNELSFKYNIVILVDGLNEIDDEYKKQAFSELNNLIDDYQQASFIISSRKFGFYNHWNLPVYELKDLNENQTKQLITNILGETKRDLIWQQINSFPQILELSHNPLMLMMILKVSSLMQGNIPSNKGILYKLFNDAILSREQKIYKTDISTKKDILSHLAFNMRFNGMFKKINVESAKSFIEEKLQKLNKSIGCNEMLNELVDNNFFSQQGDDLEFHHETQQEYFVALEIKNQFFKSNKLNFDYSDNKWFEPILIASDLITTESERLKFFEIIFIGEKNSSNKLIDDFTVEDINPKFHIACKIAFNLKEIHPRLYKQAEIYLHNYLIIWLHQKTNEIEIVEFEKLIEAVASLSSISIFEVIFYKYKYLCHWFYNREFDENYENYKENYLYEEKFYKLTKAFVDNLSDFGLFYNFINSDLGNKNVYWVSKSILANIKRFKSYLIQNTS